MIGQIVWVKNLNFGKPVDEYNANENITKKARPVYIIGREDNKLMVLNITTKHKPHLNLFNNFEIFFNKKQAYIKVFDFYFISEKQIYNTDIVLNKSQQKLVKSRFLKSMRMILNEIKSNNHTKIYFSCRQHQIDYLKGGVK